LECEFCLTNKRLSPNRRGAAARQPQALNAIDKDAATIYQNVPHDIDLQAD
jgi:hypothetical protein